MINLTPAERKLIRDRVNCHRIIDKRKFGTVDTITYSQVLQMIEANGLVCYWTGATLTLNGTLSDMSLDRLDNSKPHTIDNVVLCQRFINNGRGNTTVEEFTAYLAANNLLCLAK
jgi:hypothetical protein